MWLILFYAVIKQERKNYNALLRQSLELSEHLRKLKNVKNENAELKEEIRKLKTQLKEQAVSKLKEGEK
jgi:cell division protein FtsB